MRRLTQLLRQTSVLLLTGSMITACSDLPTGTSDSARLAETTVPGAGEAAARAFVVGYVKVETGPSTLNWLGSVGGDRIDGTLETMVTDATQSGPILHIQTVWTVFAREESFVAELDGTLHTLTGQLRLNGRIVSGWLEGARVHESGVLVGMDAGTGGTIFRGTLNIMPGSAY